MFGGGDAAVAQHTLDFGHGHAVGEIERGEGVAAGVGAGVIKARGGLDIALAEGGEVFIGHHTPVFGGGSGSEQNIIIGQGGGTVAGFQVFGNRFLHGFRERNDAEFIALAGTDENLGFILRAEEQIGQSEGTQFGIAQTAAQER